MNIFVLSTDPKECAQFHCDKHVVKMILETTQLLNNALIANDPSYNPVYRQTHKNHPCSLWAASSKQRFEWLMLLGLELCKEYTFRYGKEHKCQKIIESFKKYFYSDSCRLPLGLFGSFTLCMPEQYKIHTDAVQSYRNYYLNEKNAIAKWSKRSIPLWWTDNE